MRRRGSKFGARPAIIDGVRFASQREGARYLELKLRSQAGEIEGLMLQPHFDLHVTDISGEVVRVSKYVGDFQFVVRATGEVVVEDAKGMRLPIYKLKKKHVEAQYGFEIREV